MSRPDGRVRPLVTPMGIQGVHLPGVWASLRVFLADGSTYDFRNAGQFYVSGQGFKPGGGPWADLSDVRIKNIVGNYSSGLTEILQLNPVTFTFLGNDTHVAADATGNAPYPNSGHYLPAKNGTEFVGLIAQDCETIMPELVDQSAGFIDGAAVSDIREIDTTPLVYALINAVKELASRLTALEGTKRGNADVRPA